MVSSYRRSWGYVLVVEKAERFPDSYFYSSTKAKKFRSVCLKMRGLGAGNELRKGGRLAGSLAKF